MKAIYPKLSSSRFSDYRIECCWMNLVEEHGEQKMWFVMVNPSFEKEPLWNWQLILRLALWPKDHFGQQFDSRSTAARIVPIRGPWDDCADDGTNDGLPTRGLALGWFERCRNNTSGQHALCNRQDRNFLPTRLLDVRAALQDGKVRLVLPAEQPRLFKDDGSRDYVTLSHCWGAWGAKNNPVLLTANLHARQTEGLAWDLLPQTFQDAFKVASWFGWDWLWIDSLCIIQDSQSDWRAEAAMMDKVYQNAQINISADLGEDSRAGCFSKRTKEDITPLEVAHQGAKGSWLATTENAFGWMGSTTSLSRAWIHRERQLSRRILHFTENELVWECCGLGKAGFASETMPGGAPFDQLFDGETKFQIEWSEADDPSEISAEARLVKVHQLWNSTCEGLSKKSVTYASDMPVILSSVAKEMHRMIPDDSYACGLWRSTLPHSLAWCTDGVRPDGLDVIAPSWSWLNTACPVKLALQSLHDNKIPVAEVLDIDIELESEDPYGAVTKGELHMTGHLRRLHFHFVTPGRFIISVIEEDGKGGDRLRLIGPDWNEYDGHVCQLTLDATLCLDGQEFECYAFFTTIAEWAQNLLTCGRKATCILLEAVEDRENAFRRIGTMDKISDEYSFKMRYTVAPGIENAEAGLPRSLFVENSIGYQGPPDRANPLTASPTKASPPSTWDLLSEFIRRNRWAVIWWAKDKDKSAKREAEKKQENCESDAPGSFEKSQQQQEQEEEEEEDQDQEDLDQAYLSAGDSDGGEPLRASPDEANVGDSDNGRNSGETSKPSEISDSSDDSDIHEKYDILNNLRRIPFNELVTQIWQHPSCGILRLNNEEDEVRVIKEAQDWISETKAYGSHLPPSEALYQFDDVLDRLKDEQGAVPWLQRLDTVKITLV